MPHLQNMLLVKAASNPRLQAGALPYSFLFVCNSETHIKGSLPTGQHSGYHKRVHYETRKLARPSINAFLLVFSFITAARIRLQCTLQTPSA